MIKTPPKIRHTLTKFVEHGLNKQQPPFGAEICSDICRRTLSVTRSEQVSSEEQIMSKWALLCGLYCIYSSSLCLLFFATSAVLKSGEYLLGYSTVLADWMVQHHVDIYNKHTARNCLLHVFHRQI